MPARCCCDVRTRRWKEARRLEGVGESPSCQGDTRDTSRGKGTRMLLGTRREKAVESREVLGCGRSREGEKPETAPQRALPFSGAHSNLQHAKPGQNIVRFVSNFITNQNIILA